MPSVHRVGQALVRVEDEAQRYMPSQASLEEGISLASRQRASVTYTMYGFTMFTMHVFRWLLAMYVQLQDYGTNPAAAPLLAASHLCV